MTKFALSILIFLIPAGICCQDSLKRNVLSIAPLCLIDRTVSISYNRRINNTIEFSVNPGFRTANSHADNTVSFLFLAQDPYWYYNRIFIRSGLLFIFHSFFIETVFQYAHGSFYNQILQVEDREGDLYDEYERLDRVYNSFGIIGTIGYLHDFKKMRLKFYSGLGDHIRFYNENIHDAYYWLAPHSTDLNQTSEYRKNTISIHYGIELGYRF